MSAEIPRRSIRARIAGSLERWVRRSATWEPRIVLASAVSLLVSIATVALLAGGRPVREVAVHVADGLLIAHLRR